MLGIAEEVLHAKARVEPERLKAAVNVFPSHPKIAGVREKARLKKEKEKKGTGKVKSRDARNLLLKSNANVK